MEPMKVTKTCRLVFQMCFSCFLFASSLIAASENDALASGFLNPPAAARPHAWWHWMNGTMSQAGMTEDLEAMARVGIGGVHIFNAAYLPSGPVDYLSPQWRALVKHTLVEASRLGIEVTFHNCAGWSSSGGPWNTPEYGMQVFANSETNVQGPGKWKGRLTLPYQRTNYYRDVAVLAFPTPGPQDNGVLVKVTASDSNFIPEKILDGNRRTMTALPAPTGAKPQFILFEYKEPWRAHSVTLYPGLEFPGPGKNAFIGELQIADDGVHFTTIKTFSSTETVLDVGFEAPPSRFYRLWFNRGAPQEPSLVFSEISFQAEYRLDNGAAKAGYARYNLTDFGKNTPFPSAPFPRAQGVVDLTAQMKPDGALEWDVPEGSWTILRCGHAAKGRVNHPAPLSGRGLECDKYSKTALDWHWQHGIQPILDDSPSLVGKSLVGLLIDSYEATSQNWTAGLPGEFRKRRGYDLLRYLPVMTGRIVESPQVSERFLWDFRRTLADLFDENYYGHFQERCHQHSLQAYTETYGNGNFDRLQAGGFADMPMTEFWTPGGFQLAPPKQAASIAHTYGRPLVGAESFTAKPEDGRWLQHPFNLKRYGDFNQCAGVNRFMLHCYAHQPWSNLMPGMTMGPWGTHFSRTTTWWEQSTAWFRYLARTQFVLQQGLFAADFCVFVGEESPGDFIFLKPEQIPKGYDYDGVDKQVLFNRLRVQDHRLVLPDGLSYRWLLLPPAEAMTPETLRRVRDLVRDGAQVVVRAPRPVFSPSLQNHPQCDNEVKELAAELWGDCDGEKIKIHPLGKGRLLWNTNLNEIFSEEKLPPDFSFDRPESVTLNYIHRRLGAGDFYFVANQNLRGEEVICRFRVTGRTPEIWRPDTGLREVCPVWSETNGLTQIPLRFDPAGAFFVVFRDPAAENHLIDARPFLTNTAGKVSSPFSIVSAKYGVFSTGAGSSEGLSKTWVDVTEKLKALVTNGALVTKVNNALASRDPAPMIVKELRLEYLADGLSRYRSYRENEVLSLPDALLGSAIFPPCEWMVAPGGVILNAWQNGTFFAQDAAGKKYTLQVDTVSPPLTLGGPWEIRFQEGRGAPEKVNFEKLISWSEHRDPGVKYFSGTATYIIHFQVPLDFLKKNRRVVLDLGRVAVSAEVAVNGKALGIAWKEPYRLDLAGVLQPGSNSLEVKVVNLWPNRLIGDEELADDVVWRADGSLKEWPKWLLEGTARTNGRITFATWKHWKKGDPLLESGLLGPVTLRVVEQQPLPLNIKKPAH